MKYTYTLWKISLENEETKIFYRAEIEANNLLEAEDFFKKSGYMLKELNYIISIEGR